MTLFKFIVKLTNDSEMKTETFYTTMEGFNAVNKPNYEGKGYTVDLLQLEEIRK